MPRVYSLGNRELLVNVDQWLQVRDFNFPYVSEENHLNGNALRLGIHVDGKTSWINEDWERHATYLPKSLVSNSSAKNQRLQVTLKLNEWVDPNKNIFFRLITVHNHSSHKRSFRLFFHHDFQLMENPIGNCAYYEPVQNVLIHYKQQRWLLINTNPKIRQYSTGQLQNGETFHDALDGELDSKPIAQGNVSSIAATDLTVGPGESQKLLYWIACGQSYDEVSALDAHAIKHSTEQHFKRALRDGKRWLSKAKQLQGLDPRLHDLYERSLLIIRTHMDKRGAIIASSDTDIIRFNKDTYEYVWPRDGALIARALIRAGYANECKPFFSFCANVLPKQGALLHKYNPDGSLGSSWHPWVEHGKPVLPIQEDETALPLLSLWEYYQHTKDKQLVKKLYRDYIKPSTQFLCRYMDSTHNLPLPSYDLWEERKGIFAFTCSAVHEGMLAGARFAKLMNDTEHTKITKRAAQLKQGIIKHLFDTKRDCFASRAFLENGKLRLDTEADSSALFLHIFDILPFDDERMQCTLNHITKTLHNPTEVGGMTRTENDYYQRETDKSNPWFLSTLWHGMALMSRGNAEDLEKTQDILHWAADHAYTTGVMAEQLHPNTAEPLSVSPLIWSHACFVDLLITYWKKGGR